MAILEERERLSDGQQVAVATAQTILEWNDDGKDYVTDHSTAVVIEYSDLECLLEIVGMYHDAMDELDTINPVIDGNEYAD